MQNDGQLAAFTAFGANPVAISASEQFTALQQGCKAQWTYLNEANAEAVENLEGAGVTFYDIDTEALKAEYQAAQEKNGASYDEKWAAAVDAAKSAVQ